MRRLRRRRRPSALPTRRSAAPATTCATSRPARRSIPRKPASTRTTRSGSVQLDAPRGMVLNRRASIEVAALTFLLAFAVACAALFGLAMRRGAFRAAGRTSAERRSAGSVAASPRRATVTAAVARASGTLSWPVPVVEPGGVVSLRPASRAVAAPRTAAGDGDWPRTTRVLPWMLAVFMAMLWLVPFDSIQLAVPSPIDLQLDRLVLPVVAGTWAGPAPRRARRAASAADVDPRGGRRIRRRRVPERDPRRRVAQPVARARHRAQEAAAAALVPLGVPR